METKSDRRDFLKRGAGLGAALTLSGTWLAADESAEQGAAPASARPIDLVRVGFVGVGVNVQMFLALLLSGFFMRRRWWIKPLLGFYILPWAISVIPAFSAAMIRAASVGSPRTVSWPPMCFTLASLHNRPILSARASRSSESGSTVSLPP